jgi:hypothetical protein
MQMVRHHKQLSYNNLKSIVYLRGVSHYLNCHFRVTNIIFTNNTIQSDVFILLSHLNYDLES